MNNDPLFILGLLTGSGLFGAVIGKYMFRRKGRSENAGALWGAIPSMISALAGLSILGLVVFTVIAYFLPSKEQPPSS